MTAPRRMVTNGLAITLLKTVVPAASFLLSASIARSGGPAMLGVYAIGMSLFFVFSFLNAAGVENYLFREVARKPEAAGAHVASALTAGLGISLLCMAGMHVTARLMGIEGESLRLATVLGLAMFPTYINALFEVVFLALERPWETLGVLVVREALLVLPGIAVLAGGGSIEQIGWVFLGSRSAGAVLFAWVSAWGSSAGVRAMRLKFSLSGLRHYVRGLSSFSVLGVLSGVWMELDVLTMSRMASPQEVGLYSAAKKLVRVGYIPLYAIITALFPRIARSVPADRPVASAALNGATGAILTAAVVMAVGFAAMGGWMLRTVYGPAYAPAFDALRILGLSCVPFAASFLFSRYLVAANRQDLDTASLGICLAVFGVLVAVHGCAGALHMAKNVTTASVVLAGLHIFWTFRASPRNPAGPTILADGRQTP